ncbi:uncharacterized protein LOC122036877 [Zingiber officinale]|uniref:uncharacterized protein LOC122036877 n=1 Tax=Zingiber officinale TaxID=94328 RepID=UPI001C4D5566|nr:uncharacterized protein LOC122036877 [Zingiber officinale]
MDVVERSIPRHHSPSDEKWLWDSSGRQLDVDGEMLLGFDLSKRSASDLLQNCDLPPPVKMIFPLEDHGGGGDHSHRASAEERNNNVDVADQSDAQLGPAESTRLLRALRLSQTRAREAERKVEEESRRRQELSKLMLEEALRLSSYRRWVMLLEAEISVLRKQGLAPRPREDKEEEEEEEVVAAAAAWWLTLALCIGIAGVGFVMGRYML